MDFSKVLFRAHCTDQLMTEPKTKEDREKGELSETTKSYLKKFHRELYWSRRSEYSNKYIEKGLSEEEQAITLLSRYKKQLLKKNDIRLSNEFITGEPDVFEGDTIETAIRGWDTKCSFDAFTFPYHSEKEDKQYYWQAQSYMLLTGAKEWSISHCLVNTPIRLILREQESTYYKMECPDESHPNFEKYINRLIEIEKCMIFDISEFRRDNPNHDLHCKEWSFDLPIKERVIEQNFKRNDGDIERLKQRVLKCREWLNNYHKIYYS